MYENDKNNKQVDGMGVRRKVIYASELTNVNFAYDGDKSLFTIGALPHVKNVYTVVVEDASSAK